MPSRQRPNRVHQSAAARRLARWARRVAGTGLAWLGLLLLTSAPAGAENPLAPPRPLTLVAAVLKQAPRMDGELEEWAGVPAAAEARLAQQEQLHPRLAGAWAGPQDASARVRVGVHGTDLYLALAITDDVVLHDPERAWWHGDSLELFINPALAAGGEPNERFGPECRQIFLMPANADLPWGVVYRGRRQVFDDGGLRGIEVIRGPPRPGGYDAEVRIPLANFGIEDLGASRLGFALALNDTDEAANAPESYLSWNQGFDLYLYPRHFGVLEIPERTAHGAAPGDDEDGGLAWLWFSLLALGAVVFLAGPGARRLAGLGARTKLVALAGVVVVTAIVVGEAHLSATADEASVRSRLEGLATAAEAVARDAAPYDHPDSEQPQRRLEALLGGARVPARAGVAAAALVALHPKQAYRQGAVPTYGIGLDQPRRLQLPQPDGSYGLELEVDLAAGVRRQSGARSVVLGSLTLRAPDGAEERHPLVVGDASATSGTRRFLTIRPAAVHAWQQLDFEPDPDAPPATLRAIRALRLGSGPPPPVALLLTGTTREGVPVLAHPRGPDQGRSIAPEETLTVSLPPLAQADRLWLLLSPARAFPRLLGDHVLVRAQVHYAVGAADPVRELRNGEHLTAERLLPGIRRPRTARSVEAFRWQDSTGFTHVQQALSLPLDPQRVASRLTLENVGPGGTLRVVAATVIRADRAPAEHKVRVVSDENGRDSLVLAPGAPNFAAALRPLAQSTDAVRVRHELPDGTALSFSAPRPASADAADYRSQVALFCGLTLALMLGVLLVVDAAGRLRYLTWRLAIGVLVAALIPLAVTIILVERENSRRTEAEYAARVGDSLQGVEAQLAEALGRVRDAARRLARHLATEIGPEERGEIHRVARLYGSAALEDGLVGSVAISGADLPALHVPLGRGGERPGLRAPRFLQGAGERSGMHVSAWDGLLLVGTARRGRADAWVRVTIGVRVSDAFLTAALSEGAATAGRSAALLDAQGRPLAQTGARGAALRRAVAGHLGPLAAMPARGPVILPTMRGDRTPAHLAVATRIGGPAADHGAWLALGLPRTVIDGALRTQRETLLGLGLLGLVLVVGVAALIARRIAAPIRRLVEVTEAVRRGEFDTDVPAAGSDEVGQLTVAFDQMRHELKNRLGDLDFLRGAQDALATSLDLPRRARLVLELFEQRFGPDAAMVLDARGPQGPAAVIAESGGGTRFADRSFTPMPGGILESALAAPRAVELPGRIDEADGMARRLLQGATRWLAVPLRTGTEIQGLVLLGWADATTLPSPERRRLLEPLAGISASTLHNARLYRLAALDDVTQLPGATAFEAALRADVELAVAGGPDAVLLRIGLDHLEHVTMRRDVELARELLRGCAAALVAVVGERVRLGRLREEELAVRLPGASPEQVRELAEAIRGRLANVEIPSENGGEVVGTTVSIGIARCPGDARSLEFLLDAAGRALASAQREGGDHVEDAARLDSGAVDVPPFEEGAIFRNERMVAVVESARRAARSDSSVLLTGETGTGKEVIASLLHRRSARAKRPFVTVNCAAFPESLLESELFGHERGAFTGAERRREGRFELADGGTLFLDEVAEMAPSAQVKLLRVLQERQFTRLGGTRTIDVNVRIVAATNKDLEQAVAAGSFREDLYYRLNVIRLEIPPLRERRQEIPPLVDLFLRDARRRAGGGPTALTSAAMDVLFRHPWPGNVRELKNVIERCVVLCEAEEVGPEHLQLDSGSSESGPFLAPRSAPNDDLNERQRRLLDYLARHGRCTNRDYYEMAGTSPRTGLRDLQDLMKRGFVVREGRRRGAVYRLP